jgi:hypothetical protein
MKLIGWGGECNVYLTEKNVFKEYDSKADAKSAREMQIELSYYDLAPEVYSVVKKIKKIDGRWSGWGYYSEQAECFDEDTIDRYFDDMLEQELEYEREEVDNKLWAALGWEYTDFHIGNYGYVTRGDTKVLVIVDTTVRSFSFNETAVA